jgi:hypothetical protein
MICIYTNPNPKHSIYQVVISSKIQAATQQMKKIYHFNDVSWELYEACPYSVEGKSGHILLLG